MQKRLLFIVNKSAILKLIFYSTTMTIENAGVFV